MKKAILRKSKRYFMTTYYDNYTIFFLYISFFILTMSLKNKTNGASKGEEIKLFTRILNFIKKKILCRSFHAIDIRL